MKRKNKQKYLVYLFGVILVLSCVFIILKNKNQKLIQEQEKIEVQAGVDALSRLEGTTVAEIDSQIQSIENQEKQVQQEQNLELQEEQLKEQQKGNEEDLYNTMVLRENNELRQAFSHSCIIGDSIVESISDYEILDTDEVVFKRGISAVDANFLIDQAAGLNPQNIFLQFGLNDMDYFVMDIDGFIQGYSSLLDYAIQTMPDTKIYVNSILTIQQWAVEKNPNYENRQWYNDRLRELCESRGISFIDNTSIINGHDELYDDDGIHPMPEYYQYWLTHMANEAEL